MRSDQERIGFAVRKQNNGTTYEFAGQKKSAKTGADGKWMVRLDPMKASAEGRVLTVQSAIGNHRSALTNVLVGDVWLCSGQSNMDFGLGGTDNGGYAISTTRKGFLPRRSVRTTGSFRP
ncbi:MAG: hypothetical protein WCK89_18705 [bacterium]